ncbi:hypothetical protein [Psychrilyobacter atlanticus]|uniref:hypothetical protein n=1 Tax=Psychrilyobacter atlanticus TaxID=271091 RepID=UPI0012EC8B31|nr:hypothetical protein [Psychrilyobacter atlanticus]
MNYRLKYAPPSGTLILTLVDNKAGACIALRNNYRGLGIGKNLKYNYIRLDTIPSLKQTQRLYIVFGFYEIEPYTRNPIEGAKFWS